MRIPPRALATAVAVERTLIATPLTRLDERVVVPRLGARSPVHLVLTQVVSVLDAVAATVEPLPRSAREGEAEPAASARKPAATRPVRSRPTPRSASPDAASGAPLPAEEQEEVAAVTRRLLDDERDDRFVGELADDDIRQAQAAVKAKQLVEEERSVEQPAQQSQDGQERSS